MRILRLDLGTELGTVDLHPFVSIVHDLSPVQRQGLLDAVRSLASGSEPVPSGLVENNGVLTELPAEGIAGLGPFTTEDVVASVDAMAIDDADIPAIRAQLDQVRKQAQIDAVYVEEVRADLVPSALADVQRIKDHLAGVARPDAEQIEAEENIAAVRGALERVATIDPVLRETRPEVAGLIERWEQHRGLVAGAKDHLDALNRDIQKAEAELTRCLEALAEAKQRAVPVVLTSAEDSRLTDLSTESFDKKGRGRKRSEEEDAEMEALLAKVGQTTYANYVMYRLDPQPSAEHGALVQSAEMSVDNARTRADDARAVLANDDVAFDLKRDYDEIKDEARVHLGPMLPEDLGSALAGFVNETTNPEWLEGMSVLGNELLRAGADSAAIEEVAPEDLSQIAEQWLRNAHMDLDAMREGPNHSELEYALELAEARFTRHARAMSRIDRMEAKAAESNAKVADMTAQIARAESGESSQASVVETIRTVADRIRSEAGAAAPLVLDGDFSGMNDGEVEFLLTELEALTKEMQIIVVSNRPMAGQWAQGAGLRRALRSTMVVATI